jgi:glycosyltransferase involved in cell wall biosynthesis
MSQAKRSHHFTMLQSGGAFQAAKRISEAIEQQGIRSELYVVNSPHMDLKSKIGAKLDHQLEIRNKEGFTVSHFRSYGTANRMFKTKPDGFGPSDIVNLHWIAGNNLEQNLDFLDLKPWFWTVHDENVFTSFCHVTHGCLGYLSGCLECPQAPKFMRNRVSQSYNKRRNFLTRERSNLTMIAPSNWMRKRLESFLDGKSTNVVTIKNPVPLNVFKPKPANTETKNSTTISLGYLGSNYSQSKNSREALGIIRKLVSENTHRKFKLICFGEPFNEVVEGPELRYVAQDSSQELIAEGLKELDVLIYTSNADNLPNFLSEAQACGVSVFALDRGGVGETFLDGKSGVLARDANQIYLALSNLIMHSEKMEFFRLNARIFAESNFNPSKIGKEYIDTYAYFNQFGRSH